MKSNSVKYSTDGRIKKIYACPYEQAGNLVAHITESAVYIDYLETTEDEITNRINVEKYVIGSPVTAFSWSPLSRVRTTDIGIETFECFAIACQDASIFYCCNGNRTELTTYQRKRDLGWINSIAVDPFGKLIATVGDERICKVWSLEIPNDNNQYPIELPLESRGVSVGWHSKCPGQLMTAEVAGHIKIWDLGKQSVVRQLCHSEEPLVSVHWNPADPDCIGGAGSTTWFVKMFGVEQFNTGRCSSSAIVDFRWSIKQPRRFAIISGDVRIFPNALTKVPFVLFAKIGFNDFSWFLNSSVVLQAIGNGIIVTKIE